MTPCRSLATNPNREGSYKALIPHGFPADNSFVRRTYLVCYDICHEKRLAKVHKTMRGFGDHLQYSIFECQMTQTDLVRCRHLLGEIIDHREDQVIFVDLGSSEGRGDRVITALGKPYTPLDASCIVVDGLGEN